jgi:hypothetical protein
VTLEEIAQLKAAADANPETGQGLQSIERRRYEEACVRFVEGVLVAEKKMSPQWRKALEARSFERLLPWWL